MYSKYNDNNLQGEYFTIPKVFILKNWKNPYLKDRPYLMLKVSALAKETNILEVVLYSYRELKL